MTGELIQFEKHLDRRRHELHPRQQPKSHEPSLEISGTTVVDLRLARISRLLGELEDLTRLPEHRPSVVLDTARADLEKARRILGPWTIDTDLMDAPQPDLDDDRIERLYRELNHYV